MEKQNTDIVTAIAEAIQSKVEEELVTAIAEAVQPKVEEIKRLKAENEWLNSKYAIYKSEVDAYVENSTAENAKLKEEIEKVTRENLFATANCGRYIREKHELKTRVAELEEDLEIA